jgi:ribosomal protein L29
MTSVTLVHPEETVTVSVARVVTKCGLFKKNVPLSASPYRVQSSVPLGLFREFVAALEGKAVTITDTNFTGLERLCDEFGFEGLAKHLSEFRRSTGLKEAENGDPRGRIAALEEVERKHNRDIVILQSEFTQLCTGIQRLAGEVAVLQSAAAGTRALSGDVSALKTQIAAELQNPVTQQLSIEFHKLQREVSTLKTQIEADLRDSIRQQLSTEFCELRKEISTLKTQIAAGLKDPIAQQLSKEFCELQKEVSTLKTQIAAGVKDPVAQQLSI